MAGVCQRWTGGYSEIIIDKEFWEDENTTVNERIYLIFHELGHCDLNRDHSSLTRSDGKPSSLMFPYVMNFSDDDMEYYFNELFGRASTLTKTLAENKSLSSMIFTLSCSLTFFSVKSLYGMLLLAHYGR